MIPYSKTDVNHDLARRAHSGTSFIPEERGEQAIQEYVNHIEAVVAEFEKYATDDNREQIVADLELYKAGYIQRLESWWSARSRVMSVMITGPARFPTERNRKRNNTADKRREELLSWSEKTLGSLGQRYDLVAAMNAPVKVGASDAVERLREKLAAKEELRDKMKAANKVIRSKKMTKSEKADALRAIFPTVTAVKINDLILAKDFGGRSGFPAYTLSNLGAEIRRLRKRIEEAEMEATRRQDVQDYEVDCGEDGVVTVIENVSLDRLQVFFESKPSERMRARLKARGFRWARSQSAWQRQLTENARVAVREVLNG